MERAATGMMRLVNEPSFQPPAGSHLRVMAKMKIMIGALTKLGTTMPVMAAVMMV